MPFGTDNNDYNNIDEKVMKLQRTDTEIQEIKKLLKNTMRPQFITGSDKERDIEKPFIEVINIQYEQGNKDKELLFQINLN